MRFADSVVVAVAVEELGFVVGLEPKSSASHKFIYRRYLIVEGWLLDSILFENFLPSVQ